MLATPKQNSASQQLSDAIDEHNKLLIYLKQIEVDYLCFHEQTHYVDENLRIWSRLNGVGAQQTVAHLRNWRMYEVEGMVKKREKWTEALKEIRLVRERINGLKKVVAAEKMVAEEKAAEENPGSEERAVEEEDEDEVVAEAGADEAGAEEAAGCL